VDTSVFLEARLDRARLRASGSIRRRAQKRNTAFVFKAWWEPDSSKYGKDYIQGFQLLIRRNSDKEFTEVQPSRWDANPGFAEDGRLLAWGPWPGASFNGFREPASSRISPPGTRSNSVGPGPRFTFEGWTWEVVTVLPLSFSRILKKPKSGLFPILVANSPLGKQGV